MPRLLTRPLNLLGLILIIAGIFLRLWHIRDIPSGYYYDEMDHVFAGEAVARYGTDVTGSWTPLSLKPLASENLIAELPALLHAPFQKIFGYGPRSGHLPNAFYGLATVALIMALCRRLFKSPTLTLLIGGTVAVNPWHIHVSRTAYEAPLSLFFQILFLYGLIIFWSARRLRGLFLACIGIFFGFFTYHGAKITLPVLVVFAAAYSALTLRRSPLILAGLLLPILLISALMVYYLRLGNLQSLANRRHEIISTSYITDLVNDRRRLSLDTPGKNLILNKAAVFTEEILRRYFFVFDPNRLFATGMENGFQFSLFVHPYFYLSGLPLLALGLVHAWSQFRRQALFLFGLILVSPVTSLVSIGYQATFRSGLTYLLLSVIVGLGIYALSVRLTRPLAKLGIYLILIAEVSVFAGQYFSRYPIISADNHHFFERLLAGYVGRLDQPVTVVTSHPFITARSLVSYLGLMHELSDMGKTQFTNPALDQFALTPRLTVTSNCPPSSGILVFDPDKYTQCASTTPAIALGSPIDSRAYYYLVSDPLCTTTPLPPYVYTSSPADLQPETLSDSRFCSTWLYSPQSVR